MPTVVTKKGEVVILSAVFRVGQRNRIVDNGGAGGILANIDPVTGIVYTNGADEFGNTYVKHPQTGVVFAVSDSEVGRSRVFGQGPSQPKSESKVCWLGFGIKS